MPRPTMLRARTWCAMSMAAMLGAGWCVSAQAGPYLGASWATPTIRYFDATHRHAVVAAAAARWNRTGAGVRLVRTRSRTAAPVLVTDRGGVVGVCGAGQTNTRSSNRRMRRATVHIFGGSCDRPSQMFAVAHEFGHVLGLGHETRVCSLMNPSGNAQGGTRCPKPRVRSVWRCRVIEPIDVRRVVRLYGGSARPVRANAFCRVR